MTEYEPILPTEAMDYDLSKPALLFGGDPGLRARAEPALAASGIRLAGSLSIEGGHERLADQISVGLVWLELDEGDDDAALDQMLSRLNHLAETRGAIVIASIPLELVDIVAARLTDRSTEILVDPDEAQRAATLALALAEERGAWRINDVGTDDAARLRKLSDEMGRIASTLARLSTGPSSPAIKPQEGNADAPNVQTIRAVIDARRLRSRFFSEELFADPAWDMLLDLFQAEIAQIRVSVSSLCVAAEVPATTALRWIKTMTEQGLFVRRADPHDGRRIFVELAPAASKAMRGYFAEVGRPIAV